MCTYCVPMSAICHIIILHMSHHHTTYVYLLCTYKRYMSHHHTTYVTSSYHICVPIVYLWALYVTSSYHICHIIIPHMCTYCVPMSAICHIIIPHMSHHHTTYVYLLCTYERYSFIYRTTHSNIWLNMWYILQSLSGVRIWCYVYLWTLLFYLSYNTY